MEGEKREVEDEEENRWFHEAGMLLNNQSSEAVDMEEYEDDGDEEDLFLIPGGNSGNKVTRRSYHQRQGCLDRILEVKHGCFSMTYCGKCELFHIHT